ncbi:MAG: hypothetical protein J0M15_13560 [Deltaproteobacteria bacterium]|nr:hypothetical protein [Deltaproteobacteria bacterium]
MKKFKLQTRLKYLKYYFRYFFTVLFSLIFFAACQKNNSSNELVASPANPSYYNQNQIVPGTCVQCNFPQTPLLQAVSQGTSTFPVTINWQLLGETSKIQQALSMGWNPQKTYSGMISVRGGLTIAGAQSAAGVIAGPCQIPSGQYNLNLIQPGMMSVGSFELPQFEAIQTQGAFRIVFQLRNAIVEDPNGDGQVDRIAGMLVPMQVIFNGGTVSCNDMGVYIQ